MSKYRVVQNCISLRYRLEKYNEFMMVWAPIGGSSHYWKGLEEEMLQLVDAENTYDGWEKPYIVREAETSQR